MAGSRQTIIGRSSYNFDNLGSGVTKTIVLARGIDMCAAREVALDVRVHSNGISADGPTFVVALWGENPAADDPAKDFLLGTGADDQTEIAKVTIYSTVHSGTPTKAPVLLRACAAAGVGSGAAPWVGSFGRVVLIASGNSGSQPQNAVISADLILKS